MQQQELKLFKPFELVGLRQKVDPVARQVCLPQLAETSYEWQVTRDYSVVLEKNGLQVLAGQQILEDRLNCFVFQSQHC